MQFETMDDVTQAVLALFPGAVFGEDTTGEITVSLGIIDDGEDGIRPIPNL